MKKICVVTGSRAEFGLLRGVMKGINASRLLSLQVVVTGMHLSPEFGFTCSEVEETFRVDRKVEMLLSSDTSVGIAKSMGVGMIGFADVLDDLAPDLLLVLGDRYEILAVTCAALVAKVPVAHVHGGEVTEGAFDESIRHALTKMAHLHFVASPPYRKRVIQLGENPDTVHMVGGLGVDAAMKMDLLDRKALEAQLGFALGRRNLIVTFHPVTLERESSASQMLALFDALDALEDTTLIFTLPNADGDGRMLTKMVTDYVRYHDNAVVFPSLGQLRYLSCLQFVDGVVGNSSSGLLEAPSFGIGTVNIGLRQHGRLKADSVIDCEPTAVSISNALKVLYSEPFRTALLTVRNPYGCGGASERIVSLLESTDLDALGRKPFYDLMFDVGNACEE